ncbi:Cupredoxin-like domain-containing protein [Paenibacillus sp. UNC496MF]|uniref:cupredoxin domain-containing protein n=1 Tax=Paenibacillus sp. UNC496MF TaxID=1502753 RepID=UPI0008F237BF|nr:cupredoxin domain-containing protein [Paenibacillus sp. UNC496MF]SFJ16933.1 Cupredoxin-like domain-containing protein [Paenibacillus sp. UNC496MF]
MKRNRWVSLAAVVGMGCMLLLGLAACGRSGSNGQDASPAESSASSSDADAVLVKAEASDFKWTLDRTEFEAGKPIKFELASTDGTHGFSIVDTEVSQQISKGESEDVEWTPDKPGDYVIKCNFICGSGHSTMETHITVK